MINQKDLTNSSKTTDFEPHLKEKASSVMEEDGLFRNPPTLSPEIPQVFFPLEVSENKAKQSIIKKVGVNVSVEKVQLRYRPTIFGSGTVRFLDRKQSIDEQVEKKLIIEDLENASFVDWKTATESQLGNNDLLNTNDQVSDKEAFFELIPELANSPTEFKKLNKDLNDFLYYNSVLKLKKNNDLDVIQHPEESDRDFQIRLLQRSREERDSEVDKLKGKYAKKLDKLEDKISKLEFDLADDEAEYKARKREEFVGAGESVLSIFMGSRRTTTATTIARRRRMTSKAKREFDETKEDITRAKKDITELEAELKKAVDQILEKYEKVAEDLSVKKLLSCFFFSTACDCFFCT